MRKLLSFILIFLLTVTSCKFTFATETQKSASPSNEVTTSTEYNKRKKTSPAPSQESDTDEEKQDDNEEKNSEPSSETKKENEKKAEDENSSSDTKKKKESSSENDNNDNDSNNESENNSEESDEEEEIIQFDAEGNPIVESEAAILINSNTGKILFEKNVHEKMYPASTTKIMTAYLTLQNLDLSKEVTASKAAVSIATDSSKMDLVEGETLTVEKLLYALMVQSANDAANVLAEATTGSITSFVTLMNETAKKLGMNDTHFANPHGYHTPEHYTTAYDMMLLAQEAMKNEKFAEIVSTKKVTISPTNKTEKTREYLTRNTMLIGGDKSPYRYAHATGIKTGFTNAAGQCLVGSANRSGMELITVVFHAPDDDPERAYQDTINMFDYAYNNYRIRTVQKGDALASTCNVKWASGKPHLVLKTNTDVKALLPRDEYIPELLTSKIKIYEDITAPIKEGTELGEIKYYYEDAEVMTAKLYASRDVSRSVIKQIFSYIFSAWFFVLFGLIVVVIILRRIKEKKRIAKLRKIKKQSLKKRTAKR